MANDNDGNEYVLINSELFLEETMNMDLEHIGYLFSETLERIKRGDTKNLPNWISLGES